MSKVYSTNFSGGADAWLSTEIPYIADLIEMNFDQVTGNMYVGEDKTSGFHFQEDSSNRLLIYPYVKGVAAGTTSYGAVSNITSTAMKYFFYEKTVDGYVFNFSTSATGEQLSDGYCMKTSTVTGDKSWCYFGNYKETFSEDGFYNVAFPNKLSTQNVAGLYSYMTNDGLYYCENLFLPIFFPDTASHLTFMLGNKKFSSTPANGNIAPRLIVPLG